MDQWAEIKDVVARETSQRRKFVDKQTLERETKLAPALLTNILERACELGFCRAKNGRFALPEHPIQSEKGTWSVKTSSSFVLPAQATLHKAFFAGHLLLRNKSLVDFENMRVYDSTSGQTLRLEWTPKGEPRCEHVHTFIALATRQKKPERIVLSNACTQKTTKPQPKKRQHAKLLFHGTHKSNAASILKRGFDAKKRKRSAFGIGDYFTNDLRLALHYGKSVVVTRVRAAHHVRGTSTFVCPSTTNSQPLAILHF